MTITGIVHTSSSLMPNRINEGLLSLWKNRKKRNRKQYGRSGVKAPVREPEFMNNVWSFLNTSILWVAPLIKILQSSYKWQQRCETYFSSQIFQDDMVSIRNQLVTVSQAEGPSLDGEAVLVGVIASELEWIVIKRRPADGLRGHTSS